MRADGRFEIELAACGHEHGIAEAFGIEAGLGVAPAEGVLRVGLKAFIRVGGGELIGAAHDDFADGFFEGPVVVDEAIGKVIEEGLIGRGLHPWCREVVNGRGSMPWPSSQNTEAVGHDAGGEGVFGGGDPVGEFAAAAFAGRDGRHAAPDEEGGHAAGDAVAGLGGFAAEEEGAVGDGFKAGLQTGEGAAAGVHRGHGEGAADGGRAVFDAHAEGLGVSGGIIGIELGFEVGLECRWLAGSGRPMPLDCPRGPRPGERGRCSSAVRGGERAVRV